MKSIGIIPARYSSTRFYGKPLVLIAGKSMIERVYENASRAKLLSAVFVATDDERIFKHITSFGGKAIMTSSDHASGTDRIREAAEKIDCDTVVNIQGDEPLIEPSDIDKAVEALLNNKDLNVSTLISRIKNEQELKDRNTVKVVIDKNNNALYFSRSIIPFDDSPTSFIKGANIEDEIPEINFREMTYYKHIGIYVYRKKFLMEFAQMKQSYLEKMEKLEQLRILENGEKIGTILTENEYVAVDNPGDIERVEKVLNAMKS